MNLPKTVVISRLWGACLLVMTGLVIVSPVMGEDEWPEFRGPTGQGIVAGPMPIATKWSETENVVWKTSVPGEGHSSPVISGHQIWLTNAVVAQLTPEQEKEKLKAQPNPKSLKLAGELTLSALCYDTETGKELSHVILFVIADPAPKHALNSYASPTPIIHHGRLYCHFGSYGTACVDTKTNKVVWTNQEFHVDHMNGPGSTPVLWKDLLICHFDGADKQFITAFSTVDGHVVWKTDRSGQLQPNPDQQKSYATPLIVEHQGHPVVISPAADWVYGYDPETGKELWRINYGKLGYSCVPRPVVKDKIAYICTSFNKSRLLAIDLDAEGDVSQTNVKWFSDSQIPSKPSPVIVEDRLYMISDQGVGSCMNAESGTEFWRERIPGNYSASPILAQGQIYFFSQDGTTTVVRDSGTYEVVSTNKLDDGFMASPAVVDGAMYLRTLTHLYRIEDKQK
jgi:hypothetical protein